MTGAEQVTRTPSTADSGTGLRRLAVLGSPIAHSLSPRLHEAAYRALGLDWEYGSADVTGEKLEQFIRSRDESWRGLSLTMPLKRDVLPLLDRRHPLVIQTGSANTVLFDDATGERQLVGYNTDVYGIVRALEHAGRTSLGVVQVLGGGATAASAIAAVASLGARRVDVGVRSPEKAATLREIGAANGVVVQLHELSEAGRMPEAADAIISTLPNGAEVDIDFTEETRSRALLFDVSYHPWPSPLAAAWQQAGGPVISGLEMLVHQALMQVRIFVLADPGHPLDNEPAVLDAMRAQIRL